MQTQIQFQSHGSSDYTIYIDELETLHFEGKVAIITNPTVAGLHLGNILSKIEAKSTYVITVSDGEAYKNQATIDFILENLFNHKFNRNDTLIAFGGGVIGDMTGFAASIYQRGIDFIQIPTTLLSQVDASVGGKTGINNQYGKNLIGAFYQPKAVYIETDVLKTLPSREFGAGVAEIVKMAVTFDQGFFAWLEDADLHQKEDLQKAIEKSVQTKAYVVSQDEKEKGLRAVLNYGHTFGHVIENETHYTTYLHGEAVAIGICMANDLSVKLGLLTEEEAERIKTLLSRYDLPTSYEVKNAETFYDHFFLDKKASDTKIKFILANGIGGNLMKDDIDKSDVIDVLEAFGK